MAVQGPDRKELDMDNAVLWIVVAVVVVALVVGLLMMRRSSGRRQEAKQREEAQRLRRDAEADRIDVQRREAEAARIDAEARLAQAEAQARAADAAQLQAQAQEHSQEVAGSRSEVEERLRRADEIDPDVPGPGRTGVEHDGGTGAHRDPRSDGPR
jgi:FtsZ-interacting cell division protein ZipA